MTRATRFASLTLGCALAACTSGASKDGGAGQGGGGATGAAGMTAVGGASGVAGSTGGSSDGAGGGATGTAGSSVGGAGAGGSTDAGVDVAALIDAVVEAPAEAGNAACPAGAVICEDFEKYAPGATSLAPDWIAYTYSGGLHVDATKPHAGKQSLHLTTLAGGHHYAEILRETRGQAILPLRHFGRIMAWISTIPAQSHWNLNMSSGPMKGAPEEVAKFLEGGMFGKLMSNYAQRGRVVTNGVYPLRGGGPETGDPGADADCAVAAPTQKVGAGHWLCWEWEFDGTSDTARLWVDGQAMNEIDALGFGTQCQGPGFMGLKMMANYKWESPSVWDKLFIGFEQYQNDAAANEVWIDDVVVGPERVGCPTP
jgi:hypothetical protein